MAYDNTAYLTGVFYCKLSTISIFFCILLEEYTLRNTCAKTYTRTPRINEVIAV